MFYHHNPQNIWICQVFNAKIMDKEVNDVRENSQHPGAESIQEPRASRPSCNSPLNAHPATPALLSWCFSSPVRALPPWVKFWSIPTGKEEKNRKKHNKSTCFQPQQARHPKEKIGSRMKWILGLAGLEMGRPCWKTLGSWAFRTAWNTPLATHLWHMDNVGVLCLRGQVGNLQLGICNCVTDTDRTTAMSCCPYSTAQLISNRLTYFFRCCFTILSSQSRNVAKVPGRHVPCLNTNRAMVVWKQANLTLGWHARRVNISKKHRKIFGTKLPVSLCCNVGSHSMHLRECMECRMKDNFWSW